MTPEELKKSIYQLAIQGKLVEQLHEEGNASSLAKDIRRIKDGLIAEGKTPKEKKLPDITEDEMVFDLPDNWCYVRVQDIANYITDYVANGSFATLKEHTKTYKTPNYALFVRTMDLTNNFQGECSYIDKASYDYLEKSRLYGGELILPNIGGSIGKAFLMPDMKMPMSLAPNSIMLKFEYMVMNKYFSYLIQSPYGAKLLADTKGGTATPKFSKTELRMMVVPLPPLEEQKRIVAKIEELLSLVDKYADAYNRLEELNKTFPGDLKKSILQYAIQGKLVEQRPEEGTADDLYAKFIANAKIQIRKHKKTDEALNIEDIPFEIPDNWKWCREGDVLRFVNGRAYKKEELLSSGKYKVLRVGNFFTNDTWYYSDLDLEDEKYCCKGDLLYAWSASFGPKIWDGERCIFHYHIWNVSYDDELFFRDYLYWFFVYDVYSIRNSTTGSTMVHVSMENMMPRLIPIPPLEEQKRIVTKIQELFLICDSLRREK